MDIKQAVSHLKVMCISLDYQQDYNPKEYENIKDTHLAVKELLGYYSKNEANKETAIILKNVKEHKCQTQKK